MPSAAVALRADAVLPPSLPLRLRALRGEANTLQHNNTTPSCDVRGNPEERTVPWFSLRDRLVRNGGGEVPRHVASRWPPLGDQSKSTRLRRPPASPLEPSYERTNEEVSGAPGGSHRGEVGSTAPRSEDLRAAERASPRCRHSQKKGCSSKISARSVSSLGRRPCCWQAGAGGLSSQGLKPFPRRAARWCVRCCSPHSPRAFRLCSRRSAGTPKEP
jgi:hypothetical protein